MTTLLMTGISAMEVSIAASFDKKAHEHVIQLFSDMRARLRHRRKIESGGADGASPRASRQPFDPED